MWRVWRACIKKLTKTGKRAITFGKRLAKASVKFKRAAKKDLALAARRRQTLFRRAARLFGAPTPPVAEDVVVSLTSFPARIDGVHQVIASLLDQSVWARKIVLYLSLSEFPDRSVPNSLARLEGDRFEIRFVAENLRPHKKLQYALVDFPGTWIATVDDDRLYPVGWLSRLLDTAAESPQTIICGRGRLMRVADGGFLPFGDWPFVELPAPSFLLFPVGSWGVLYSPGALDPIVSDRALLEKLAPLDDDTWHKAMSLLQNVPCRASGEKLMPSVRFKRNSKLWHVNESRMDETLDSVFGHFGSTDVILAKEATLRH